VKTPKPARPTALPAQHQKSRPGREKSLKPRSHADKPEARGADKLKDKVAIITGADSGIGRAVATAFAREGADVVVVYLAATEDADAKETQRLVRTKGREAHLIRGDIGSKAFCKKVVEETIKVFGHLDILVNNAAEQHPQEKLEDITEKQLVRTFRTNIFAQFFLAQFALKYLPEGGAIVNTTSVTAYHGNKTLLDYSSTKGAIVSFTRSLSQALVERKIRVNAVAPGPIWTPLIASTFPPERIKKFGKDTPMGRPGQPEEVAPSYVFLASDDASYITGQILHPNGGNIING
jgi:NAD(P)-dependent dehydrogenase (short-subunit alcohol dehydrogenase family)